MSVVLLLQCWELKGVSLSVCCEVVMCKFLSCGANRVYSL